MDILDELDDLIAQVEAMPKRQADAAALDAEFVRLSSPQGRSALLRLAAAESKARTASAPVDYLADDIDLSDLDLS